MAAITIYYFGLICHVGTDKARRESKDFGAAIIRDNEHQPVIAIRNVGAFLLTSAVTFSGTPAGAASADDDFLEDVPSLFDVSGQDTSPAKIATNAWLVPYLAGSTLTVQHRYPCKAVHRQAVSEKRRGCVARITRLNATVNAGAKIHFTASTGTQAVDLNDGTEILVANWTYLTTLPQPCGAGHVHGHIQKFEKILVNVVPLSAHETGRPCTSPGVEPQWVKELIRDAPLPEPRAGVGEDHDHAEETDSVEREELVRSATTSSEETDLTDPSEPVRSAAARGSDEKTSADLKEGVASAAAAAVIMTSSHVECGNTDWP